MAIIYNGHKIIQPVYNSKKIGKAYYNNKLVFNHNLNYAWVAVGGGHVFCSTDGIHWKIASNYPRHFSNASVRYGENSNGKGIWVLCADEYGLYYSEDGDNWHCSYSTLSSFSGVRYGRNTWVASSDNGLYYSGDGKSWTNRLSNLSFLNGTARFAYDRWYAFSTTSNYLYYSLDGYSWNTDGSFNSSNYTNVGVFSNYSGADSYYIATTNSVPYFKSIVANAWSRSRSNVSLTSAYYYYYSNRWIGNGPNGPYRSSNNGSSWSSWSGTIPLRNARYANNIFVANSENGGLYYSTGAGWTKANIENDTYGDMLFPKGARYSNGLWVAANAGGHFYYSYDARDWFFGSDSGLGSNRYLDVWGNGIITYDDNNAME